MTRRGWRRRRKTEQDLLFAPIEGEKKGSPVFTTTAYAGKGG